MESKKIQFSISSSVPSTATKRFPTPTFLEDHKDKRKKVAEITTNILELSDLQKPLIDSSKKVIPLPSSSNNVAATNKAPLYPCVKYVASGISSNLSNGGSTKYGLLVSEATFKDDPIKRQHTSSLFVKTPKNEDLYSLSNTTIDDYEEMPVCDFGAAMLRGMGWDPDVHTESGLAKSTTRKFRPGFLGLGADPTNVNLVRRKKQN